MDTNELPPWQRGTVTTPKQAIRKEAKRVRAQQPQSATTVANNRMSVGQRFWVTALAIVGTVAVALAALIVLGTDKATDTAPKAPAVAAVSSRVPDNAACDGFTVKLDSHPGGNFSPVPLTANSPDKAKQELLDQNKYEPTSLYGYYVLSPIYGKYPEVKSERDLVDKWESGACYSDVGKKLYNDWAWYWKQAVLTPRDHMPDSGVITGATQDGQVFQQTGKINDSTGYDVSYPGFGDQFNHFARNECTQPGKAGVSSIPGVQQSPPGAPPLIVVPPVETPPVIIEMCPPDAPNQYPPCWPPVILCPPDAPNQVPPCWPIITTTTTPPPVILCPDGSPVPDNGLCSKAPEATRAPGNGGTGTGGTVKYGGGGAPPVDGPASAPAVTPSATVAPTSKPAPPATQTSTAPPMTVTSVAPTSEKPVVTASTQPPKTAEIPTLPTNGPFCGDKRFCAN